MSATHPLRSASPAVVVTGIVIALLGLILAAGGVLLAALHGSWYYAFAGAGLMGSGVLLAMNRAAGVWLYGIVLFGTLVWTYSEVGLDFWGFVPRIVFLLLLGIIITALLPRLPGAPPGSRPSPPMRPMPATGPPTAEATRRRATHRCDRSRAET